MRDDVGQFLEGIFRIDGIQAVQAFQIPFFQIIVYGKPFQSRKGGQVGEFHPGIRLVSQRLGITAGKLIVNYLVVSVDLQGGKAGVFLRCNILVRLLPDGFRHGAIRLHSGICLPLQCGKIAAQIKIPVPFYQLSPVVFHFPVKAARQRADGLGFLPVTSIGRGQNCRNGKIPPGQKLLDLNPVYSRGRQRRFDKAQKVRLLP